MSDHYGPPVQCPACGLMLEGPVTLPNGTRLEGHIPNGSFCHPVQLGGPRRRKERRPTERHPDERAPLESVESREQRAERVRAQLRADSSWRRFLEPSGRGDAP